MPGSAGTHPASGSGFSGTTCVVARSVPLFDGELRHDLDEVREALALDPDVPLTTCDARDPGLTVQAL